MVMSVVLQSCTSVLGTGRYATVAVEEDVVITDLRTNQAVRVGTTKENTSEIRLRNGRRHALRIEKDSLTTYVLMSPKGDALSMLNALSPYGIGFVIDHFNRTAFSYDRKLITTSPNNAVARVNRAAVEDSLRERLTPVVAVSIINGRESNLVAVWGDFSITLGAPFELSLGLGSGVNVLPWLMPLVEADFRTRLTNVSFGVQIQEPSSGICGAYRYGWSEESTFYVFSAGITAQWYRFELRLQNQTSAIGREASFKPTGWYFGLSYSLQMML